MSLQFQFISDTHLEYLDSIDELDFKPVCKNLVLAGDIGYPGSPNYNEFIIYCSRNFENVFVIFGNHEYYNGSRTVIQETMSDRKSYMKNLPDNVYFLDNSCVYVNKMTNQVYHSISEFINKSNYIKLIGSTMWTQINHTTAKYMNDYNSIYILKQYNLTVQDTLSFFKENIKYILYELDKEPEIECILITHHAIHPICCNPDYPSLYYSGYVSDIPELYLRKNLKISISGHTHKSMDTNVTFNVATKNQHTIRFVSNQYGYKPQYKKTRYNVNKFISI